MCVDFSRACALVRFKHIKHLVGAKHNDLAKNICFVHRYHEWRWFDSRFPPKKQLKLPRGVLKKLSFVDQNIAENICRSP